MKIFDAVSERGKNQEIHIRTNSNRIDLGHPEYGNYGMEQPDYSGNLLGTRSDGNDSTKSNKSIIAFGVIGLLLVVLVMGGFVFRHKLLVIYKSKFKSTAAPVQ